MKILHRLLPSLLALLLAAASSSAASASNNTSNNASSISNISDALQRNSVSVSIPPSLSTLSTTYNSTSSTSGFLFDIKCRSSTTSGVILYGIDINLIDSSFSSTSSGSGGEEGGVEVEVYSRVGTFQSYEYDEGEWTHWFTTTVVSSGLDMPTALLASRGTTTTTSSSSSSSTSAPSASAATDGGASTTAPTSGASATDDDDDDDQVSAATTDDDTATDDDQAAATAVDDQVDDDDQVAAAAAATDDDQVDDDDDDASNRLLQASTSPTPSTTTSTSSSSTSSTATTTTTSTTASTTSTTTASTSTLLIGVPPIYLPPSSRLSLYISTPSGPHLRYSSTIIDSRFYKSDALLLDANGAAKRKGWDGQVLYPRAFSGGLHYYMGNEILEEWHPVNVVGTDTTNGDDNDTATATTTTDGDSAEELLPSNWASPTLTPTTFSPTVSISPTSSLVPSSSPTASPSGTPSTSPTSYPTWSPVSYSSFSTPFEAEDAKPVYVYAGSMFDLRGRKTIEINSIGIHTYLTSALTINLYIRSQETSVASSSDSALGGNRSYVGHEDTLDGWELRGGNITIVGNGMGVPTYLPYGSFEPILLKEKEVLGVYITSIDGPYLRSSMGEEEGKPHSANPDMVIYEGIGKRYPIESGGLSPRVFNGVFEYVVLDTPTSAPTMDLSGGVGSRGEKNKKVANATFAPVSDLYIVEEEETDGSSSGNGTYGRGTQLMVDGFPKKVSLLYFDLSVLNGNSTVNKPNQVLKASLRLYSMSSQSMFGGYVDILANGGEDIDEDTTSWLNTEYGSKNAEGFERMGQFRSVWPEKFYEMDVTQAFRGSSSSTTGEVEEDSIPTSLLVRLSSDLPDGVMYRSREGDSDNGPRLFITFAYNPDTKKALAREFGSDPPTVAPTVLPVWEDAVPPATPDRSYFNYDPSGWYGPDYWENMDDDGYYEQFRRLKTDISWNRCGRGERQSPRDLCATTDKCLEFHQTRPRIGEYGLTDESWARPTPLIMHNKLRLQYPERRSEWERPEPPGADFARNVFNSGIQDILHIDLKVRSEHRLCGKQYDGEMQLFYIHREGNLEALSVLIEVDSTEINGHFQVLLDYFQDKFDQDASLCLRRRTKARALFGRGRDGKSDTKLRGMSSSSSIEDEDQDETTDTVEEEEGNASTSSLGSLLYQKIHDSFLRHLQQQRRRRTERPPTWNPLEPWYVLQSIHFWGYSGSITEPPCFEEVHWRVIDVPMKIHFNQYLQLKRLMFDHVDPDTCQKTSTHYDESNARPVQSDQGGATYRCRRSDYASDMERAASGRVKGFVLEENWWGVNNLPYVTGEFPNV